jgi:hypothetical protein
LTNTINPLLTSIDRPELHKEIRESLKSSDAYLQLVLFTGVTKFSHVSVFSDLNNVTDICMHSRFYDLCGITQEELKRYFIDEIAEVLENKRQYYLAEVKRFYNGYRFYEKPDTVYNPFGLLNHVNEG